MFRRLALHRRDFLKGLSLGAATPLLEPMLARLQAEANGARLPQRVVFVMQGNGIKSESITPVGVDRPTVLRDWKRVTDAPRFRDLSLNELKLAPDFEPLAQYQDRLSILMGLSGRACQGGHSNNFGALGVYSSRAGAAGQTIDCALADALKAPFPHVGLGITNNPLTDGVVYNISAWGKGTPTPTQCRPTDAHHALFGSVTPAGQADFATLPSVLDHIADELKQVESRLAGPERAKLQAYAHALEGMNGRHAAVREKDSVLRRLTPPIGPGYTSETETDRFESHVELGAAALISGLTNCLVLSGGCGDRYFEVTYRGLGIGVNMHTIGHGQGEEGKSADELAGIVRRFYLGLVARLADKLQAVPEGNGTMLDNTAIVFLSDAGDGHHAANWEFPMLVLGDLGGKLKTRGRYLEFPRYGAKGHHTIANFYSALLHAVGAPRDRFGVADQELPLELQTGPLDCLLA